MIGFVTMTTSKPAISETPRDTQKIKLQKGQVQELDSSEPSQLIEMMAKDLHNKQMKAHAIMKEAVDNINDTSETAPAVEDAPVEKAPQAVEAKSPFQDSTVKKVAEKEDLTEDSIPLLEKPAPKKQSMPWLKTALSLIFVLSLMGVLATVAKKYLPLASLKQNHFNSSIQVLQSMTLGLKQQIMVILVEGHRLVIGVSNQNMNLLYAIPENQEIKSGHKNEAIHEASIKETAFVSPASVMTPAMATAVNTAPVMTPLESTKSKIEKVAAPMEEFEPAEEIAKVVAQAPQNQFSDHDFRKKLEAFERYQADQAHIASLREKVREQMAAFSQRRETGEPVSSNVSDKIRSVMRSMKSFNSLNQQQQGQERSYGRNQFQKTA
ncbi:MAG: FliO/MopB family protein [Deltaproteobacteria bacterium]|nr:MAG: FliO/MopB family protein [Deltaproteobacteria bacterium]